MKFAFDAEYNQRLYDSRQVTFEDALEAISVGEILSRFPFPEQHGTEDRWVLVVLLSKTAYFVPYIVNRNVCVLETVYPAAQSGVRSTVAKGTESAFAYLSEEERETIELLRRVNMTAMPRPTLRELKLIRRTAKKFIKRERKGRLRISANGVQQSRERIGKLSSQNGVMRRW